jgi:glutamate-ammonia-ligase adenylyltransferase
MSATDPRSPAISQISWILPSAVRWKPCAPTSRATGDRHDYEFAVIAMGRWGGREIGYFSDADAMYVVRAKSNDLDAEAKGKLSKHANKVALQLSSRLKASESAQGVDLDADLRPEGKNGPLVRSFSSYQAYYAKWSQPWEAQALLRARPVAGDEGLIEDFLSTHRPAAVPRPRCRTRR